MQLMRHEKHGLMHAYSPQQVEAAKAQGWSAIDRHPGLDKAQGGVAPEAPAAARRTRAPKDAQP